MTPLEAATAAAPIAQPIRALIAHPSVLVADALAAVLGSSSGIEIVSVCYTGIDALDALRAHRPDVFIAGPMSDRSIEDLVAVANANGSSTASLVIADDHGPDECARAMQKGVVGFITTSCSLAQLDSAVRRVANGEIVVLGLGARSREAADDGPLVELTSREREILRLVSAGRSNTEIAEQLFISQHTVRTHVQNIRAKLNVRSKLEAAMLLMRSAQESAMERQPVHPATTAIRPFAVVRADAPADVPFARSSEGLVALSTGDVS